MQVCFNKLGHLSMRCIPRRSTLSDANKRRSHEFFESLYHQLYHQYYPSVSPDSRRANKLHDRLFIIDSTTIKLFSDVMRGMGAHPLTGKQKGGAKAHVLLKANEDVPRFVCLTHATTNDKVIIDKFALPAGSVVVFDKAYNSYRQMAQWGRQRITWVTRMLTTAAYVVEENFMVTETNIRAGVSADQRVTLGRPSNKKTTKLRARRICFYDAPSNRQFEFITNNFILSPLTIARIYKKRWQIESLFKRIKQNYPLRYFLGDNENAIKIQIWCALITDLLIKIIHDKIRRRKWSYANIASIIRLHLMSYVNLFAFLNNPEKISFSNQQLKNNQLAFQT